MEQKLIMTKGLPGSGKSTFANQEIINNPGKYKRINRDDLRRMIDVGTFSGDSERHIIALEDYLIKYFLKNKFTVITDDTNLNPKNEVHFRKIALEFNVKFEIKDFTDIPIEECIKRDMYRTDKHVGEKVIQEMYDKYLKKNSDDDKLKQDNTLQKAIIVDIDGTVAKNVSRNFYDWDRVDEDDVHKDIIDLVMMFFKQNYYLIFVSGRDSICFEKTKNWINEKVVDNMTYKNAWNLLMRKENDNRPDEIVKKEIFFNNIYNKYYIEYVIDDRDKVVKMWRKLGLRTLQVCEGTF